MIPELIEMQTRALVEAALNNKYKKGLNPIFGIMVILMKYSVDSIMDLTVTENIDSIDWPPQRVCPPNESDSQHCKQSFQGKTWANDRLQDWHHD
jgi:hypothetical protein